MHFTLPGVHFLGVGCILQLLCESNWDFLYPTVSVESQNTSRKIIPRTVYDLFFPYTFIEFFIGFQSESLDRIEQKMLIVLFARIVELNSIVHKIVDEVEFAYSKMNAEAGLGHRGRLHGGHLRKGVETVARKRKAGDGTVRQRKDGRWEGRIVIGYDDNGYPKTKNVLAKTKKECVEKLQKLKEECGGLKPEKVRPEMPFGDWLTYWYENHSKPKIRPTTQETYESRIRLHIIPEIGDIPLNKLTQNDLQQFYGRLKKSGRKRFTDKYGEGLSDRMVRMCHATCRSALEKAVQDGLIRVNPAIGCKLPPKKAQEMQVLTREELQRFLIQAKFEGYYEVFLLDLATGLRRGELMALQWDDLNFKTGVLNVNKQVYDVRGQLQISTPKTKNSVRKIVLPPAVVAVLLEYKETVDSRWMFQSPVKEDCPITPGVVRRRLQFILEHAGCKHVRFHDLRHPYVKHTTKKYFLQKQKSQTTNKW